jgi:hypothetical protein
MVDGGIVELLDIYRNHGNGEPREFKLIEKKTYIKASKKWQHTLTFNFGDEQTTFDVVHFSKDENLDSILEKKSEKKTLSDSVVDAAQGIKRRAWNVDNRTELDLGVLSSGCVPSLEKMSGSGEQGNRKAVSE